MQVDMPAEIGEAAEEPLILERREIGQLGEVHVREAHADDPTRTEIVAFIAALSEDEQTDLVALMWLGRGDGTLEDWTDLRDEARDQHNNRTASYLLGEPLLSDYLEEGLSQFGFTCAEFEIERL